MSTAIQDHGALHKFEQGDPHKLDCVLYRRHTRVARTRLLYGDKCEYAAALRIDVQALW
jgi:hypothetical protein